MRRQSYLIGGRDRVIDAAESSRNLHLLDK
jgi:hypothetical protein